MSDNTSPAVAVISIALLIISEALPFVRRRIGSQVPVDGILFGFFVLMFYSRCITEDSAQRIEAVIQRDITGDGIVGRPPSIRVSGDGEQKQSTPTTPVDATDRSPVYSQTPATSS